MAELSGSLTLFHFLLDHAPEREQALIDRGRNLADESYHFAAVLENAGFPDQLITERIDLGVIARRCVLERLESNRLVADSVGGFALLAADAFEPVHDLRALRVERVEQASEQELCIRGLVGARARQKLLHRLLGLVQRRLAR